ncbi:hypothetical protein TNIN_369241 [Trichonephila inaurata madagascariensis]|uniref:Uncharacterized protein n=1 Tax=Trichonephila inaurata madagascariensis TaxID=2747483 RepID=A0A8X6XW07_9ARAC|nr:hypothetical protein TNIN_369241 [Trichonephila inaurata madagascariensis]
MGGRDSPNEMTEACLSPPRHIVADYPFRRERDIKAEEKPEIPRNNVRRVRSLTKLTCNVLNQETLL